MSVDTKTAIVLDKSLESKLQINFNVTLHALACRYASLDIADVMGTHLQNVTSNIIKTRIDRDGRVFASRSVCLADKFKDQVDDDYDSDDSECEEVGGGAATRTISSSSSSSSLRGTWMRPRYRRRL